MNARPRGEPLRERGMPSSHRPQQRCGRVREMRPSCRGATIDGSSRKVLQEASASSSCENRTGRICLVVTPPWRRLCIRTWSLRVVRHHFEAQSRLMPQGEERDKLAQTDGLIHYGRSEMCDYSLHNVASRAAKLGDKLVVTDFAQTITRGFAAIGEPDVAVCVLPGTELAFEAHVQYHHALSRSGMAKTTTCGGMVGRRVTRLPTVESPFESPTVQGRWRTRFFCRRRRSPASVRCRNRVRIRAGEVLA